MKITKLSVLVIALCLLVAGSALAWGGNGRNLTVEERQQLCNQSSVGRHVDIISELTGKTAEEVRDLCSQLREDGQSIADYLKEQGLYEDYKEKAYSSFEEKVNAAVENGKLTEEKATEVLKQIKDKIEDGTLHNGTGAGLKINRNFGSGKGQRGRGKGCR